MKVVIAMDSFKGSLTSMEAAEAVRNGILAAKPDARIIIKPVADGGEGTVDALTRGTDARRITAEVSGPYREPVSCSYAYLPDTYTAVIEMAAASGDFFSTSDATIRRPDPTIRLRACSSLPTILHDLPQPEYRRKPTDRC